MGTQRGKILDIDLSSGTIKTTTIKDDVLRKFIGGVGLAAKLFFDRVPPDADPLGEKNVLFLMAGPLAGTSFPTSSRLTAAFKSPLTNIWGQACAGGNFAAELKAAGYDGMAITGVSKKPVYILVEDDKVEIKDASDLWGKDTYETTDILKKRHGAKVDVLEIGPAGENLVKFANIMNGKWGSLSRCGGGAVMGSKKLKAAVVKGTGKVVLALPVEYDNVYKTVMTKLKESIVSQYLRDTGTNYGAETHAGTGGLPAKNWTEGDNAAMASKIGGTALTEQFLTKPHACFTCPIGCKRSVKVAEGPYRMEEGAGPQYETAQSFGSQLMNENLASLCKINETVNKLGLDSISCGITLAFAMECFEKGLIASKDLGDAQLRWGNADDILAMVDKIAHRQGFGDVLAEGSKRAAQKIGKNAQDYAVEVKGLELPVADPRALHGLGLAFTISNRGACHVQNMMLYIETGWVTYPEIGLTGGYDLKADEGKGKLAAMCESLAMLTNCVTMCQFALLSLSVNDVVEALKAATGFDYTVAELQQCAERNWMLTRGLNNLMGVTAADDRLPKQVLIPLKNGPAASSVPDIKLMQKEYYEVRGLDAKGRPLKNKLESLGLSELATKLY